jgi:hypothetical protein
LDEDREVGVSAVAEEEEEKEEDDEVTRRPEGYWEGRIFPDPCALVVMVGATRGNLTILVSDSTVSFCILGRLIRSPFSESSEGDSAGGGTGFFSFHSSSINTPPLNFIISMSRYLIMDLSREGDKGCSGSWLTREIID